MRLMRAPEFWKPGHTVLPGLLSPLSLLYDAGGRMRRAMVRPARLTIPVVCVGNLVAGGAGKTPAALAIGAYLASKGRAVHFLSRGYGGSLAGPVRVDPTKHTAQQVGDEPLLLAAQAPAWVAHDRRLGGRAAAAAGAGVIVMDDGFQNPSLHKDVSFLVIDAGFGLGNGRIMPAGPLREAPATGLRRADAVVYIGDPGDAAARPTPQVITGATLLHARLEPGPEASDLAENAVVAFAGIGRPGKFFDTLRGLGCRIVATHAFADHHVYRADEIMALVEEATVAGARLVTTAKDAVRLPAEARPMAEVLPVTLRFGDMAALERLLAPVLGDD
jgi:tetraacyldisaccharide 4'-kinase